MWESNELYRIRYDLGVKRTVLSSFLNISANRLSPKRESKTDVILDLGYFDHSGRSRIVANLNLTLG